MKYDLARLMYEALIKNKNIIKKASEDGDRDTSPIVAEKESYQRDPNWENELDEFINYFFSITGQFLYSYKNKPLTYNKNKQSEVDLFFSSRRKSFYT